MVWPSRKSFRISGFSICLDKSVWVSWSSVLCVRVEVAAEQLDAKSNSEFDTDDSDDEDYNERG